MSERPGPYVPISVTVATGKTGAAIVDRFGPAGLGAWVALIAAASPRGDVLFRHEDDWAAIGLGNHPPEFTLLEFLKFLGTRKQTRRTSQGRAWYVVLTQWERWNYIRRTENERQRKSRYRQRKRWDNSVDTKRDTNGTGESAESDTYKPPYPPLRGKAVDNSEQATPRALCPLCSLEILPAKLNDHIANVHGLEADAVIAASTETAAA